MSFPLVWSGRFHHLRNSFVGNCSYKLLRPRSEFSDREVFNVQKCKLHNRTYQLQLAAAVEGKIQNLHHRTPWNIKLTIRAGSVMLYSSKSIIKPTLHEVKAVQCHNFQHISERKVFDWPASPIVFDIETTGLSYKKESIIEIAFWSLCGGSNSTFQTLVNPGKIVENSDIHGITSDMVNSPDVPRFDELIPVMLRFIRRCQFGGKPVALFAHNGRGFDFRFLAMEFQRCSVEIPEDWLFIDTYPLAKKVVKPDGSKLKCKKLEALREYYEIPLEGPAHRAMQDVMTLSYVLQRLTHDLKLPISSLLDGGIRAADILKVPPKAVKVSPKAKKKVSPKAKKKLRS